MKDTVLFAIENSGDLKILKCTSKHFPKTLCDLVFERSVRELVVDIFESRLFSTPTADGDVYILSGKPEDEIIFGFLVSSSNACNEEFRQSLVMLMQKPPEEKKNRAAVKFSKLAPAVRSLAYASGIKLDYKENELKGMTLPRVFEALRIFASVFISLHDIGVRGKVTVKPIIVEESCGFDIMIDNFTKKDLTHLMDELFMFIKHEYLTFHIVDDKYTVRYIANSNDPSYIGLKYRSDSESVCADVC